MTVAVLQVKAVQCTQELQSQSSPSTLTRSAARATMWQTHRPSLPHLPPQMLKPQAQVLTMQHQSLPQYVDA